MNEQIPRRDYLPAHLNLIRHGREICHARKPACGECILLDVCPSAEDGKAR